ncbi:MAG: hypothetical protein AAGJ52_00320 [Pseudomonadota bacterium]
MRLDSRARNQRDAISRDGKGRSRLGLAISSLLLGSTLNAPALAQFDPGVFRLSGLDGVTGFRMEGLSLSERSGYSISAIGDLNGDGIGDLIIGAPYAGSLNSGSSYVVFGRDTAVDGPFNPSLSLASLDGSNGFRLDGAVADDLAGWTVSRAGDFNGDGLDDVIIGTADADPNGFASGSAFVVFGRDTASVGDFPATLSLGSLDGTNGLRLDGVNSEDRAGRAVGAAGDINGDGIDDVIIGAFAADPNGSSSGSSYVVFGRQTSQAGDFPAALALSSLDGSIGFRLDGGTIGEGSGGAVSGTGDVNGDGVDDLIIGSPFNGGGRCYVVFGRDTLSAGDFPASLALASLDGLSGFRLNATAGWNDVSVSGAGDLNGDGLEDIAIGSRSISNTGTSYVVFGRDTQSEGPFPSALALNGLNGTVGFMLNDNLNTGFNGHAVSEAGDFDDDGNDDLIIGAFGNLQNGQLSGSSFLVFGRDSDTDPPFPAVLSLLELDGLNGLRFDGRDGEQSGTAVGGAADINGDGIDDLMIGAPAASNVQFLLGRSYVVFGRRAVFLTADQSAIDFGALLLDTPSPSVTVTITNTSERSVLLGSLAIGGAGASTFFLSNDLCSRQPLGTLTGINDQCTFAIGAEVATIGDFNAVLTIPYDSAQSPLTIDLRATGVLADAVFEDRFEP